MQENKNIPPTVEELICDESFVNYCLDKSHPDHLIWKKWLIAYPANQEIVDEAAMIVQLLRERPSDTDVAIVRQKLLEALEMKPILEPVKHRLISSVYRWLGAAAVLACVGMAFLYTYKSSFIKSDDSMQQTIITQSVPSGQVMHLRLVDGTKVDLAAGSKFAYPALFNDSLRIVDLEGDARFAVNHVENKPFLIRTGDLQVRVLGTVFNVQSFNTDQYVRVALFEGSVQVEKGNQLFRVVPGEVLVYNKKQDTFSINHFDKQEEEDRINGLLVFDRASYGEVGARLANKYKVTFIPDETVDIAFSGKIADSSIEPILKKLSLTTSYHFSLNADTIIVKQK